MKSCTMSRLVGRPNPYLGRLSLGFRARNSKHGLERCDLNDERLCEQFISRCLSSATSSLLLLGFSQLVPSQASHQPLLVVLCHRIAHGWRTSLMIIPQKLPRWRWDSEQLASSDDSNHSPICIFRGIRKAGRSSADIGSCRSSPAT